MTVPDEFEIPETDRKALKVGGITLIPQSPALSLTAAISDAISRANPKRGIRILYGDTLVHMAPDWFFRQDIVAVQNTTANYSWAFVQQKDEGSVLFSDEPPVKIDSRQIVCGYYNFSDPSLLFEACRKDSIVEALNFYAENKPLECLEAERWLDFGHLPLYFRSKKDIFVKRVFNELLVEDHVLVKRSKDTNKIRAEANWFESLPRSLQVYVPRYLGREEKDYRAGYALEYLYAPLLSDLSVFGALPLASWLEIIKACFELMGRFHAIRPNTGAPEASNSFASQFFDDVLVSKTWSRLKDFEEQSGISIETEITLNGIKYSKLGEVVEDLVANISRTTQYHIRFWHGDLFFGNMFYDFTAHRVLCIDPRGQLASGERSLYGDMRYDIAKLAHSIIGQYDKILLGRATLKEEESFIWTFSVDSQPHQESIEDIFTSFATKTCGMEMNELLSLTAILFMSMLPLHNDQPHLQRQFLAAGLNLAARVGIGDTV